jgi:hypothetical protein
MSLAKLVLSGSLVAGGLVLGAFTLHGYLDPQWTQKQAQAVKIKVPEPVAEAPSINAFHGRTQFVAAAPQEAPLPPPAVKVSAKADAKPADVAGADPEAAAKAAARKRRAEARKKLEQKKLAEKAEREKMEKAKQKPQQATFKWPWNW